METRRTPTPLSHHDPSGLTPMLYLNFSSWPVVGQVFDEERRVVIWSDPLGDPVLWKGAAVWSYDGRPGHRELWSPLRRRRPGAAAAPAAGLSTRNLWPDARMLAERRCPASDVQRDTYVPDAEDRWVRPTRWTDGVRSLRTTVEELYPGGRFVMWRQCMRKQSLCRHFKCDISYILEVFNIKTYEIDCVETQSRKTFPPSLIASRWRRTLISHLNIYIILDLRGDWSVMLHVVLRLRSTPAF